MIQKEIYQLILKNCNHLDKTYNSQLPKNRVNQLFDILQKHQNSKWFLVMQMSSFGNLNDVFIHLSHKEISKSYNLIIQDFNNNTNYFFDKQNVRPFLHRMNHNVYKIANIRKYCVIGNNDVDDILKIPLELKRNHYFTDNSLQQNITKLSVIGQNYIKNICQNFISYRLHGF